MKKMNNKGFSLVELIVVVAIMAVLMAVLVPTLIRNVEKTRVQKDKSAIAEIHHATELAFADEKFVNSTAKADGATVSNGSIAIADLFADTNLSDEVAATVGKTVKLSSKMSQDCNVKVVHMDPAGGKAVFHVTSTKASQNFYIDSSGELETYTGATDGVAAGDAGDAD